jgi:precorrin-8X/cobalt-precorrin-8 methylmutase
LVVGMVVGFVNASEAKELLMDSGLVYITVAGRKGGSAVAAATVNALADLAAKRNDG